MSPEPKYRWTLGSLRTDAGRIADATPGWLEERRGVRSGRVSQLGTGEASA